jgi:hypothetical protein
MRWKPVQSHPSKESLRREAGLVPLPPARTIQLQMERLPQA